MNLPSSNPLSGGPMTDEELTNRYPELGEYVARRVELEEGDEGPTLTMIEPADITTDREFRHVPVHHYLVLMQVNDTWVVAHQSHDKEDRDQAMLAIDDDVDGNYEVRAVDLDTMEIVPNIKEV